MNASKLKYLVSGLTGRASAPPACPACGSREKNPTDRKYFHVLWNCRSCGLMYRWPRESDAAATAFYQTHYAEPGLTTSLPDQATLAQLLETNFAGSEKDFAQVIGLLQRLGIASGMRVLDFGANWGYATRQFITAGYNAVAFEISVPRARFGEQLGIEIHTSFAEVGQGFDAVYSSHVLEHVPNPLDALRQQIGVTKPGGMVAGHTPNGSLARLAHSPKAYRENWGLVHPVLLTEQFISHVAGERPFLVASRGEREAVAAWERNSQVIGSMDGPNLFFAIQC